ncbi:MAG: hypothetical protein V4654_07470 [Bdellovibrionota bacterium]
MSWLRKIFSYFLGQMAYQYAFGHVKKKAVLIYLKTLQAMRRSLMVALIIFCILQLMVLGFLGAVATAIWLLPQDTNTKLYILLSFFAFLFIIPFVALCYIFSERLWFRLSGAEKLLKEA